MDKELKASNFEENLQQIKFNLGFELTRDWSLVWVFFPLFQQSAELQKKLHHLEVQLNNEKQHMGDLEHKYRYGATPDLRCGETII